MIRAAGILFVSPEGKVLLMRRTDGQGWAFPGGGIEGEETAEDAARREILEETGQVYDGSLSLWTRRVRDDVDFTTFLAKSAEFVPTLNDEHDAFQWVDGSFALSSSLLHPGVTIALRRFGMNEVGIAEAIMAGELSSPQRYGNLLLVALRITGTGASYRRSLDEFVWRDPSIYLNDDFLKRCNGLPVIAEHPKGNMLNSEEFRDRIVGTITLPYIRGEEVWGIAKILDMRAAELIEQERMSTSPAVVFATVNAAGFKHQMQDGSHLLIEGEPALLDHLALLLGPGVWDKGGPLSGVESVDAEETPVDTSHLEKLDRAIQLVRQAQIADLCQ